MNVVVEHVLWTTALAVFTWFVLQCWKPRAVLQHLIWTIVLIKLLFPPLLVAPWSISELVSVGAQQSAPALPAQLRPMLARGDKSATNGHMPASLSARADTLPLPISDSHRLTAVCVSIWIVGMLLVATTYLRQLRALRALIRSSPTPPPQLREQIRGVAERMQVAVPELHLVADLDCPVVFWYRQSFLLCPTSWIPTERGSAGQARWAVLAHELAHVRRRDHWLGWVECLATIIWWWLPTTYLIRNQLKRSAELCCDEWVLTTFPAARRAYATALVAASRQPVSRSAALILGLTSPSKRFLRLRLSRLRRRLPAPSITWTYRLAAATLLLALIPHWTISSRPEMNTGSSTQFRASDDEQRQAPISVTDSTHHRIRAHMEYLLRDGGHWVTTNQRDQAGDDHAIRYHYHFEWGLNRQFAEVTIRAEYERRPPKTLSEVTVYWDAAEERMAFHQYDFDGSTGLGESRLLENGDEELILTKRHLDGTVVTYRHHYVRQDGEQLVNDCFQRSPDGTWEHLSRRTWRRVRPDSLRSS